MTLTSKERASLRAEAHHLSPLVHVGYHGLSDPLLESLDDALRTRELVKVQVARQSHISARDAARELAATMRADVVQVIGRTVTLYRENPALDRPTGAPPPWRT
jgi:RNA-binding protein